MMKQDKRIHFSRILLSVALLIAATASLLAEDVEFRASAPSQVIADRPFQLSYSVNQRVRDFQAPEIAHFDIVAGPYTSQSSSTSIINGKRTTSFTLTYTYTLIASVPGTYTIPPATVKVDGQSYNSNGVQITVLPADEQPSGNASSQSQPSSQQRQTTSSSSGASSDNIFIRTVVSKTRVHEQEAVMLSYKLYFAGVDVAQFTNNTKIPEFTGFLKQDLEQGEIQTELEHYNGRNYQTAVLYKTLLFPQHSGDIKIDPATFEAILRVQTRAQVRSIFDDFFNSYTNVAKTITAPGMTIHVEGLPSGKPSDFSGGVGQFTLTSNISQTELTTNDAVTVKLVIQGSGNMKLLKTPAIDWPEGFEPYDPKVTNNFKTSSSGMSGSKTIEYLAIPRASGEYTIPSVTFSYFDIQDNRYKTLASPEYVIRVKKGANEEEGSAIVSNYVNKEDIKSIGEDIRYIATSSSDIKHRRTGMPFGSLLFWLAYLLPLLVSIVLFVVFRKQIRENADQTKVRYKQANKVAQKRLKQARILLEGNNKSAFYEEIERAAWQYLSDRLSIPTSSLTKDNIAVLLRDKRVSEQLIADVHEVLSTAEFARYAPSSDQEMDRLYSQTVKLINQLESQKI